MTSVMIVGMGMPRAMPGVNDASLSGFFGVWETIILASPGAMPGVNDASLSGFFGVWGSIILASPGDARG